jgi:hypothetical protein
MPAWEAHVKVLASAALAAVGWLAATTSADGAVTGTRDAERVAKAMATKPSVVRGARFVKLPPRGRPAAVSSTKLVGFPRAGKTFGVLSSGNATRIDNENAEEDLSFNNGGVRYRGTRDTVVLRVDLQVPSNARCLSFSFRFLSEEYNEFINTDFNDAFVAELDRNTWSGSGTESAIVKAPHNFAFARSNKLITVNSTGDFNVTDSRARGTTYDAGTRRLRASRRITPGRHSVYFTIFDQGDREFDSSVVLDGLAVNRRTPCVSGASLD